MLGLMPYNWGMFGLKQQELVELALILYKAQYDCSVQLVMFSVQDL